MFTNPDEAREFFYKYGRTEDKYVSIKLLDACRAAKRPVEFKANHHIAEMEAVYVLDMANRLKDEMERP